MPWPFRGSASLWRERESNERRALFGRSHLPLGNHLKSRAETRSRLWCKSLASLNGSLLAACCLLARISEIEFIPAPLDVIDSARCSAPNPKQADKTDVASMAKPLREKHPAHVRSVLGRCRISWADICRKLQRHLRGSRNPLDVRLLIC
jgi:hypothetical protein